MRVVFRVDASTAIGAGHVVRCATLAQELASKGAEISFISRVVKGHYIDWLQAKGFYVEHLPIREVDANDTSDIYSGWLGAPLAEEIREMSVLLQHSKPVDWLVVDHYAIDRNWHAVLRPFVQKIMCIDDLANRQYDCDLLLDQNLYSVSGDRYTDLLPKGAKILLGPQYALLRPEFAECRKYSKIRDGKVRRVFIFMGGGDTFRVTNTVLNALSQSRYQSVAVDVVMGVEPKTDYVRIMKMKLPNIKFHYRVDRIADLMVEADLAIGATGVATWERAAVGLPSLAVSLAENQRVIGSNAHEVGLLTWIGSADQISEAKWVEWIHDTFSSPKKLRNQSEACFEMVDAKGVQRVTEAMQ